MSQLLGFAHFSVVQLHACPLGTRQCLSRAVVERPRAPMPTGEFCGQRGSHALLPPLPLNYHDMGRDRRRERDLPAQSASQVRDSGPRSIPHTSPVAGGIHCSLTNGTARRVLLLVRAMHQTVSTFGAYLAYTHRRRR